MLTFDVDFYESESMTFDVGFNACAVDTMIGFDEGNSSFGLEFTVEPHDSADTMVEFDEGNSSFGLEFDANYDAPAIDYYDGAYVITPKASEEQILATQYKLMTDDVTVRKVPFFETSNEFGETVYIASEV